MRRLLVVFGFIQFRPQLSPFDFDLLFRLPEASPDFLLEERGAAVPVVARFEELPMTSSAVSTGRLFLPGFRQQYRLSREVLRLSDNAFGTTPSAPFPSFSSRLIVTILGSAVAFTSARSSFSDGRRSRS